MSQYSTSKMLGKLSVKSNKERFEEESTQEIPQTRGLLNSPQLSNTEEHKLDKVLANILGASLSKNTTPMDKS